MALPPTPEETEAEWGEAVARILEIAREVERDGGTGLFVLSEEAVYTDRNEIELTVPQMENLGTVADEGRDRVVAALATIQGALLFTHDGRLCAYGARAVDGGDNPLDQAEALSGTYPDGTAILTGQDGGVHVFQKGRLVRTLDLSGEDTLFEIAVDLLHGTRDTDLPPRT